MIDSQNITSHHICYMEVSHYFMNRYPKLNRYPKQFFLYSGQGLWTDVVRFGDQGYARVVYHFKIAQGLFPIFTIF